MRWFYLFSSIYILSNNPPPDPMFWFGIFLAIIFGLYRLNDDLERKAAEEELMKPSPSDNADK